MLQVTLITRCCNKGFKDLTALKKYLNDNKIESNCQTIHGNSKLGKSIIERYSLDKKQTYMMIDEAVTISKNWMDLINTHPNFINTIEQK